MKFNGIEAFCFTVINGWQYKIFMTKERENCPHKQIKPLIADIQTRVKTPEGQKETIRWILQNETNADWSVVIDKNPKNVAEQASSVTKIVNTFTHITKMFTERLGIFLSQGF